MAKETLIRDDMCGEFISKEARMRVAVRTDEDRPEAAEYLDIGPCCFGRPLGEVIARAREMHPVMADGQPS